MAAWWRKLAAWLRRDSMDAELQEEMRFHLEMKTSDSVDERAARLLVSLFSILALTLAAIGLYGVMAYMVTQRTREIGIRIALGARPGSIVGEILRSGGVLIGAGALAGILLAALAARSMATLLYGVPPTEVTTYLSATGVLLMVGFLACLIPGRRATSIDHTQALRDQ